VIPALGLILYSGLERRSHERADALKEAFRIAHMASEEHKHLIENGRQILFTLSHIPEVQKLDSAKCERIFSNLLKKSTGYTAFAIARPDGKVIVSAPAAKGAVNFSDRAWFKRTLKSREFVIGEYLIGRISDKPTIILAYPVIGEEGSLKGILAIGLDLEWLNTLISKSSFPGGATLSVIDSEGTILLRYPDKEKLAGKSMPEAPVFKEILAKGEGTVEAPGFTGEPRLFGFASMGKTPEAIYAAVGIPVKIAYAESNRMLARNLIFMSAIALISLAAARFAGSGLIIKPVRRLLDLTKRLSKGELTVRTKIPYGSGEFGMLAEAFDNMAESLEHREAQRDEAHKRIKTLNRILKTLSEINELIVKEKEERRLLCEASKILVEQGKFKMAWIGMADFEANMVIPVAYAGFGEGYPEEIDIRLDNTPEGRGPTGTALRNGKTAICTDTEKDELFAPWREAARKYGYRSSAALPIKLNGAVKYSLNVYSAEPDAFDAEIIVLLEELAGDIGYALQNLREVFERKKAEERVKTHLEHMKALRTIDMAITASLDLHVTLDVFINEVISQLRVNAASVLLLNPHTLRLEYSSGRGFKTETVKQTSLRLGEGYAGRAALSRKSVIIHDISEAAEEFRSIRLIKDEGFRAYIGVPLIAKGYVKGVLEIFHKSPLMPDPEWLDFLESLAGQAAIAIDNATLFDELQRSNEELIMAYDSTIEGWSRALDYRDKETEGHSERVTEMTVKISKEMGIDDSELVHIRRGALLHDIGKLGVPDHVLFKPDKLSDEEWALMKRHPEIAYNILSPISYLKPAIDIPYCHHEKWDGTGYPRGLRGEQIPLSARIFAVVDIWDALLSDRPYRPAWPKEKVKEHILSLSGSHFAPEVVEAFIRIFF
jgi:HD-GYP domain-containing protein (c-di-GMP phosphodiesterase class II)/HAMP domain-containing protein